MAHNIFYQCLSEHFININSHCTLGKVSDNSLAGRQASFSLGSPQESGFPSSLGSLHTAFTGGGQGGKKQWLVVGEKEWTVVFLPYIGT
jgi:hypothetical protein